MINKEFLTAQQFFICKKFIKKSFNFDCEFKVDELILSNQHPINKKKLPLLFALPGIIMFHLICAIEKNEENDKKLNSLLKLLTDEPNTKKNFIKELLKWSPKNLKNTVNFSILPMSIIAKNVHFLRVLNIGLVNTFVLSCMLIQARTTTKKFNFLSPKDIKGILLKSKVFIDNSNIFHISQICYQHVHNSNSVVFKSWMNDFQKKIDRIDIQPLNIQDLYLHQFIYLNNRVGIISKNNNYQDYYKLDETIGLAVNISLDLHYDLWEIRALDQGEITNSSISGFYLSIGNDDLYKHSEKKLFGLLFASAIQSHIPIEAIIETWDKFINDPQKQSNLKELSSWMSLLPEQKKTIDSIINNKELYNSLTGFDRYFSDSEVKSAKFESIRRKLLSAFRNYISPELELILNAANDEFDDICNDIHYQLKKAIKKGKILKEKKDDEMLNVAQEIWDENNFKHILQEDLEDIDCEPMNNRKRGSRGRFLVKVAKFNGKDLSEKLIFKELKISR